MSARVALVQPQAGLLKFGGGGGSSSIGGAAGQGCVCSVPFLTLAGGRCVVASGWLLSAGVAAVRLSGGAVMRCKQRYSGAVLRCQAPLMPFFSRVRSWSVLLVSYTTLARLFIDSAALHLFCECAQPNNITTYVPTL